MTQVLSSRQCVFSEHHSITKKISVDIDIKSRKGYLFTYSKTSSLVSQKRLPASTTVMGVTLQCVIRVISVILQVLFLRRDCPHPPL